MRLRKLLLLISVIIVSTGVAGALYFTYFAGSYSIRFQTLTSADGTQLASLVYTPTNTSSGDLPGIVVAHGFVSNKQSMQGIALELVKCGFVVISIDFRGHGQSGGTLAEERNIYGEEGNKLVDDVMAAVEYLKEIPYVNNDSIGLVGHSMGGASVMGAAILYPEEINATVSIGMVGTNYSRYEMDASNISNLLIAIGALEELISYEDSIWFLKNVTGLESVTDGVIYGYFQYGNATKLHMAPRADHILEITDTSIINETCTWFRSSFYTGSTPEITNNLRQIFIILAVLGSLLGFFVFAVYLKPIIFKNRPENPRKNEDPNARKKILYYIGGYCLVNIIVFLLITPLSWIFSSNLNLILSNYLIALFSGYAIGIFLVFYLVHRYVEKDSRSYFRRIQEEISHNFSRSIIYGLFIFLYSFGSLTAILHWSLFDLFPTTREWGATITVALLIFPYVFLDQLYMRNLQSYVPQGRFKELIKVVLLNTIAKIILFVPILFLNLGFASLIIIILIVAFPFLEILATWIYMYSGRNFLSPAIYTTLILAWFLVALMPFGNYVYTLV